MKKKKKRKRSSRRERERERERKDISKRIFRFTRFKASTYRPAVGFLSEVQIRDLSPVTVGRSWNPDISNNRSLPFQISKHSRQTILRLRLCLRRRRRLYSLSDKACILVQNYFNRFPRMKSVIVCFCTISYTSPSFILLLPPIQLPLVLYYVSVD